LKESPKNVGQPFFGQNEHITFTVEKSYPKNSGQICNFHKNAQSKQSPNGRKFAQSGLPE
jgi:hypothetical protein